MDFKSLALTYKKAKSDLADKERELATDTKLYEQHKTSIASRERIDASELDYLHRDKAGVDKVAAAKVKLQAKVEEHEKELKERLSIVPGKKVTFFDNHNQSIMLDDTGNLVCDF